MLRYKQAQYSYYTWGPLDLSLMNGHTHGHQQLVISDRNQRR